MQYGERRRRGGPTVVETLIGDARGHPEGDESDVHMGTRYDTWHPVSYPLELCEHIPPERKTVLVWCRSSSLPWCGYIRIASNGPYWVVYHGNPDRAIDVIAWCDCLPDAGPDSIPTDLYDSGQAPL